MPPPPTQPDQPGQPDPVPSVDPAATPGSAGRRDGPSLPGRVSRAVDAVRGRIPTPVPRLGMVTVTGRSMEPTLHEGDRLLVMWGVPPRPGKLALVEMPEGPAGARPLSVKRIAGHDPDDPTRWWVERDNPREGVDSWLVGGLAPEAVRARVLVRVPEVTGDLGGAVRSPWVVAAAALGLSKRSPLRRRRRG